jgi:5-methylcytosine-specific restriction enzyme A
MEAWRRRRRLHLVRSPLCVFCLQFGRAVPATICDHVTPHKGDFTAFLTGALQSLCEHCHNSTKRRIELGRPRPEIGADGYPIESRELIRDDARD